jgi:hypothetical protein
VSVALVPLAVLTLAAALAALAAFAGFAGFAAAAVSTVHVAGMTLPQWFTHMYCCSSIVGGKLSGAGCIFVSRALSASRANDSVITSELNIDANGRSAIY